MTPPTPSPDASASGRERRRHPRVKGPFDATWEGASGRADCRVWDLSVAGCFVESLATQRSGEPMALQINAPEGSARVSGVVVYSVSNQGFAVQFTAVDPEALRVLQAVVDRRIAEGQSA
jgi:hypothetical protein